MAKRKSKTTTVTEIIEYAIESAIKPGDFIGYNDGWSFVSDLEKVKEQIDAVVNKKPLQAVDLIETFIAVCYEKAEGEPVWLETVEKVMNNHSRKYSFMPGFKRVVAGQGPSTEPSFIERAKTRWRK
ncbi:MAG: hypothetical protein K8R86_00220 [Bacteroidales bacterium]|nr:hypothetical protein [Bacteroidales bacterium]